MTQAEICQGKTEAIWRVRSRLSLCHVNHHEIFPSLKHNTYSTLPNMQDMAAVVEALAELSSLNVINKYSVYQFVESLYVPENGGFGPEPGLGTTPPSTYSALACLEKIGELGRTSGRK